MLCINWQILYGHVLKIFPNHIWPPANANHIYHPTQKMRTYTQTDRHIHKLIFVPNKRFSCNNTENRMKAHQPSITISLTITIRYGRKAKERVSVSVPSICTWRLNWTFCRQLFRSRIFVICYVLIHFGALKTR